MNVKSGGTSNVRGFETLQEPVDVMDTIRVRCVVTAPGRVCQSGPLPAFLDEVLQHTTERNMPNKPSVEATRGEL